MEFIKNITRKPRKGKLTKANGKWFVDCVSETSGKNNWHDCFPIYELENESEHIADLILVQKFNRPISELEQLDVDWIYLVTDGVTNFGYEYASLILENIEETER